MSRNALACLAVALAASAAPVGAQPAYPARPIHFIVPFAPGGSSDVTARLLADGLQKELGQTVVVENQGGASGIIGTGAVARAAPDGYTIMFSTSTNQVIAPLLRQPMPYEPVKDFTAIAPLVIYDGAVVVGAAIPADTLKDFIAWTKANPGKASYGSAGIGSTNHLATEKLRAKTGAELLHVPYKGSAASMLAVASGEVAMTIDTVASALPLVKAGKVKILAVNTPARMASMPQAQTFVEAGITDIPNYWQGVTGPAGLPRPIVERLNRAIGKVMGTPEMAARMSTMGGSLTPGSPEDFAARILAETVAWREVIRVNNIKPE